MILVLFVLVLIADFMLLVGVAISIFFPMHRIWPPTRKDSWQFYISWIISTFGMMGSPLIAIIDYGSLGDGNWFNFFIGGLAILDGVGVAV